MSRTKIMITITEQTFDNSGSIEVLRQITEEYEANVPTGSAAANCTFDFATERIQDFLCDQDFQDTAEITMCKECCVLHGIGETCPNGCEKPEGNQDDGKN